MTMVRSTGSTWQASQRSQRNGQELMRWTPSGAERSPGALSGRCAGATVRAMTRITLPLLAATLMAAGAAPAAANVSCVFNAGTKTLSISASANQDSAVIIHEPNGSHILVLTGGSGSNVP